MVQPCACFGACSVAFEALQRVFVEDCAVCLVIIRHGWARSFGVLNPECTGLNSVFTFFTMFGLCVVSNEKASYMMTEMSSCNCFCDIFITAYATSYCVGYAFFGLEFVSVSVFLQNVDSLKCMIRPL